MLSSNRTHATLVGLLATVSCACTMAPASGPPSVGEALANLLSERPLLVLGERHRDREWHEQVNRLLRDPALFCTLDNVVVEFGNARHQGVIDRYISGDPVSTASLQRVWRDTTQWLVWDSPVYASLLSTIREMNGSGACDHGVRVLLGDPPIDWSLVNTPAEYEPYADRDDHFADVVEHQVLDRGENALIIVGSAHTYRRQPAGRSQTLVERIESTSPATVRSVIPIDPATATDLGIEAGQTPRLFDTVAQAAGQRSFARLISANTAVQVTRDGEKAWIPLRELPWRSIAETVDALLVLDEGSGAIDPDPAIYRDAAYVAELRRRGRIMESFYGFEFLPDLDALLNSSRR